jgi:integrase
MARLAASAWLDRCRRRRGALLMTGTIIKRGGSYSVIIELERDPSGKRRREWHSGYRTKREAEEVRIRLLSSIQRGEHVEPSKLTVAAFLQDRWLPAIRTRVRPSTFASYQRNVKVHVIPALGSVPVQRLSGDLLTAAYAVWLDHGRRDGEALSPRSVRYLHAIIRRALADARRWGLVTRNAADQADPPRSDRNRDAMRVWTADQVRQFLAHVRDDRLCGLWLLLATTGLRRGEACGLGWDDIDLAAARLAVRRNLTAVKGRGENRKPLWSEPKTNKSRRSVALDAGTVEALRLHRKGQLEERLAAGPAYRELGLVFCREDGSELDPDWVSKRFERLAKAAGVPRIRLHDVRHTHATPALQAGVHVKVVSERLGHATVGMTLDTYSHVIPALEEDAAAKVAALMLGD